MPLVLQEPLPGWFDAPDYACFALGAFAREGRKPAGSGAGMTAAARLQPP